MTSFLDQYADLPPPPPGYTADFHRPNHNVAIFIFVSLLGLVLAITFVAMRFYTKAKLTRSIGWDDCKSTSTLFPSSLSPLSYCVVSPPKNCRPVSPPPKVRECRGEAPLCHGTFTEHDRERVSGTEG